MKTVMLHVLIELTNYKRLNIILFSFFFIYYFSVIMLFNSVASRLLSRKFQRLFPSIQTKCSTVLLFRPFFPTSSLTTPLPVIPLSNYFENAYAHLYSLLVSLLHHRLRPPLCSYSKCEFSYRCPHCFFMNARRIDISICSPDGLGCCGGGCCCSGPPNIGAVMGGGGV